MEYIIPDNDNPVAEYCRTHPNTESIYPWWKDELKPYTKWTHFKVRLWLKYYRVKDLILGSK